MPLISVVLICFDRDKYIIDAINSVLENKDVDTEIILSTHLINDTIIKIAKENSIKIIYLPEISYFNELIVEGIKNSKGDIISFLEDDDLFLSGKIKHIKEIFSDKDVGFYHNSSEYILEKDEYFGSSFITIKRNIINVDKLISAGALNDTVLYLCGEESGMKMISDKEILTYYRVHGDNISIDNLEWKKLRDKTLLKLPELFPDSKMAKIILERDYGN